MTSPLIRKLECFRALSEEDKRLLDLSSADVRTFAPRTDIILEGEEPSHVHLVVEGWAVRYKLLPDGDRPIMAYLIPGDLCDVQVSLLARMDHSIGALSACRIAFIPRERIERIMEAHPRLARALWWSTLVDEAILREWLVNTTHRQADRRLGHLICEMLVRSRAVGLTEDDSFELPITQEELGDTIGISAVHVNRTLQSLRGQGLITSRGRRIVVDDLERLVDYCGFDPTYLHHQGSALFGRSPARGP